MVPVYNDNIMINSGHYIYTNFRVLNLAEDGLGCKSFTVISTNSLLVYVNRYYLQVYLEIFSYKILDEK